MFKLKHFLSVLVLITLLIPTRPAYAASATITVSGTAWGLSTCYIGATEGNVRFNISDLQAAGINTYRIYGGMSRWEATDDDGVYGSPTIAQIKVVSPQALMVPPNLAQEAIASRPKYPTPAATPDQMWAPLMGGLLTLIVGGLSLVAGMVWLIPSLGPSIYLQTQKPADPASRFLNVVLGHLLGLAAGFAGIFLFNAFNDPITLQAKELTAGRLGAAVVALVLTLLLTLLLKAHHPPAGATTLLTALGSIQTAQDATNLMIGVLIIAIAGELLRKTRTSTLTTMTVEPKIPAKDGKL